MVDTIILVCTIIAYLAYRESTSGALKEAKMILAEKFEPLRTLNDRLIKDLTQYGQKRNSLNKVFMQSLILNQGIEIFAKVQRDLLTTDNLTAIRKAKSKLRIEDITKNLEIQIKHHSEIRTAFDYFVK